MVTGREQNLIQNCPLCPKLVVFMIYIEKFELSHAGMPRLVLVLFLPSGGEEIGVMLSASVTMHR